MREDKRTQTGRNRRTSGEVQQEELLADAFQACMEEQLSFIPPEREISRMHTFSPGFNAAMEELCRTKGKLKKREMTRREFVFGFNRIAACILLMFVVGGVCVGGYLLSEHSLTGAGSSGLAESTAESTEETADLAVPEEETTAAQDSTASGGQDAEFRRRCRVSGREGVYGKHDTACRGAEYSFTGRKCQDIGFQSCSGSRSRDPSR